MSNTKSCLLQMRKNYNKLSAKEIEIANFILEDPKRVLYYTIDDFSKALNVSEATVSRFVRKLGFEKFQIFKVTLANEITNLLNKENKISVENLEKNFNSFNKDIFKIIINSNLKHNEKIINSMINNLPSFNKIAFLGIGKANEFALNTYNSFPNTESTLLYNQDFICQRNIVMELNKNDLAILFCTNEEDEEYMLNLLDILKSNHVITIGFSYNSNSLFSKSVTYSLTTDLDINSKFSKDLANEIYILLLTRYMYINCFS